MTTRGDLPVFFHPDYNRTDLAFETTRKASAIARSLRQNPIDGVHVIAPRAASRGELETVHDPDYVDAVRTGDPDWLAESNGIGWDDALFVSAAASTGGARDAVLAALDSGGIAGSLSSGLHHARHERGSGFCTFNGLVVGARAAIGAGATRVLILDLDAHCGGGTASLIGELAGVEQIDVSVNMFDRYQSRPDARLNLCSADDYLAVIEQQLADVTRPEGIDVLLYNAGMDPHEQAGGVWGIDAEVLEARERLVFGWARDHRLPVAWVVAGGYCSSHMDLDGLVALHRLTIEAAAAHGDSA